MDVTAQSINIDSIASSFTKMYEGLSADALPGIEKELAKIVPSASSKVLLSAGFDENNSTLIINIFVTNPQKNVEPDTITFSSVLSLLLQFSEIKKLPDVMDCIDRLERNFGDNYTIDGIPVSYNEDTGMYYFRFTITKE